LVEGKREKVRENEKRDSYPKSFWTERGGAREAMNGFGSDYRRTERDHKMRMRAEKKGQNEGRDEYVQPQT